MEASGFRSGRCCRSRRLRKQSRGTHQTVPPGYGSPVSCEAVRSIHQLQPRYTRQRKPQWTRPSERRLETARCDVRFGDVPARCRDAQSRLHSPRVYLKTALRCAKCRKRRRSRRPYGDCTEDTIVGCIAKYKHIAEGAYAYDPVFVLSAILDWAGIAHNERGYLELTADYRTRAEGR